MSNKSVVNRTIKETYELSDEKLARVMRESIELYWKALEDGYEGNNNTLFNITDAVICVGVIERGGEL